jgi:hypothetical protein
MRTFFCELFVWTRAWEESKSWGAPVSRGTFGIKGHLKNFSGKCLQRGRGRGEKCYRKGHLKNFSRKCCGNAGINQRPLMQKCNLNNIFHVGKGHFATGKRALSKTWGGGGWPPRFLLPCVWTANDNSSQTFRRCIWKRLKGTVQPFEWWVLRRITTLLIEKLTRKIN